MAPLSALRPLNEAREKRKFLSSLEKRAVYNPNFAYGDKSLAVKTELQRYEKHLSNDFIEEAEAILRGCMADYGSEAHYQERVWGRQLSRGEVDEACRAYLEAEGLTRGQVRFKWNAKTLVTTCSRSPDGTGTVNLVASVEGYYREHRLASLLDHEVGTHFIRSHNQKAICGKSSTRPWWKEEDGPKGTPAGWLLATEEGLASLNTHRSYCDRRLWTPALLYFAAEAASRLSFWDLWHALWPLIKEDGQTWRTAMRVKRGVTDTSKPGGYYKDQAPFNGAMRLLRLRRGIDWIVVHSLKVSVEELEAAVPYAKEGIAKGLVLLPSFVLDQEAYRAEMELMAEANGAERCESNSTGAAVGPRDAPVDATPQTTVPAPTLAQFQPPVDAATGSDEECDTSSDRCTIDEDREEPDPAAD